MDQQRHWWRKLKKPFPTNPVWTEEQIAFTLKHIGPMSDAEVGKRIGKSASAVRKWVQRYDEHRLYK